jgi:hypothetical protein
MNDNINDVQNLIGKKLSHPEKVDFFLKRPKSTGVNSKKLNPDFTYKQVELMPDDVQDRIDRAFDLLFDEAFKNISTKSN